VTQDTQSDPAAARGGVDPRAPGRAAKRGVALGYVRAGVIEVLMFPSAMITARLLSPAEFGITTAALFFIQLASRLSDMGFTAALVRSKTVTEAHLASVFVMNVCIGVVAFLSLMIAAPFVAAFYGIPETGLILRVAAVTFLVAPLGAIPNALLDRGMRFRQCMLADWYQSVTFAVVSVLLAWLGFSFWSLVYARLAAVVVQTLSQYYFWPWRPSLQFSWTAVREVISFAAGMHTKRLLEYTAGNLDNLVVGKLMGMTALGLYDKAFGTMNRFLVRLNAGGPNVMFRIFSLIHEDRERFRRAYAKTAMSASLLGLPLFATMAVVAPDLIVVLFGDQWRGAVAPFQVLCAAGALKLLNSYASAATQAAGRIWPEVWRQLAYIGLILVGIYLFRNFGPPGAALGVLVATVVMAALMHALLKRATSLSWLEILRPQYPAVLCALGTTATAWMTRFALEQSAVANARWLLLALAGLAAVVFYAWFTLFAPIRDVRALVDEVLADLLPDALKRRRWVSWYLHLSTRSAS
jgi:O-antigen/teichoic acid export membrane protein